MAVFDLLVTDTAQREAYVVYLFREDGTGAYLSLNQGTTAVRKEVGRRYRAVLTDRAATYGGLLRRHGLAGLQLGPIDLDGRGGLTRGYEAGNIAAVYYPANAVPNDDDLASDLDRLMSLYRALVEARDYLATDDASSEGAGVPDADVEARCFRWHRRTERNRGLARAAKRHHGPRCQVCGFKYAERYGSLGEGYIEAHHLTPFAELEGRPTALDPVSDFAVVCASCHRMLHKQTPPLTLDELRATLI